MERMLRAIFDGEAPKLLHRCAASGMTPQRFLCEVLTAREFLELVSGRAGSLREVAPWIRKRLVAACNSVA